MSKQTTGREIKTKKSKIMKRIIAKIKDSKSEWNEEYSVPDGIDPEVFVNGFIKSWNDGEDKRYHRILVSVSSGEDVAYDFEAVLKDSYKFIGYCNRQQDNAYGNRGVKADYRKIISSHTKFTAGTWGDFIKYVRSHKGYDHDNLSRLIGLTEEQYRVMRKEYLKKNKT